MLENTINDYANVVWLKWSTNICKNNTLSSYQKLSFENFKAFYKYKLNKYIFSSLKRSFKYLISQRSALCQLQQLYNLLQNHM